MFREQMLHVNGKHREKIKKKKKTNAVYVNFILKIDYAK